MRCDEDPGSEPAPIRSSVLRAARRSGVALGALMAIASRSLGSSAPPLGPGPRGRANRRVCAPIPTRRAGEPGRRRRAAGRAAARRRRGRELVDGVQQDRDGVAERPTGRSGSPAPSAIAGLVERPQLRHARSTPARAPAAGRCGSAGGRRRRRGACAGTSGDRAAPRARRARSGPRGRRAAAGGRSAARTRPPPARRARRARSRPRSRCSSRAGSARSRAPRTTTRRRAGTARTV